MPWTGNSFPFTEAGITANAPTRSGVYMIWGTGGTNSVVYVGETNDLQRRLLEHRRETNTCIARQNPATCGFELVESVQRVQRQNQLIQEFRPTCNQMLG